jgi:hypothetical protein
LAAQLVKDASGKARQGAFYDGITNFVTGGATMIYNVSRIAIAQVRSAADGACLFVNDGPITVSVNDVGGSLTAPGANSRIDIIYGWQRDFALDGTNSDALVAVKSGTAAVSPVAPVLPVGAVEIARATVGAGITATTSATITNTIPFTAAAGATVVARNLAELGLASGWNDGVEVLLMDSGMSLLHAAGGWVPSRPNTTGANRLFGAQNQFTNAGGYASFPVSADATALQTSFTKYGAATRLRVRLFATGQFSAGVGQNAFLGLRIGTTDYDIARRFFLEGANRQNFAGEVFLSGIAAGTVNVLPRFRMSAASVFTFYADDYLSYSVEEVS